MTSEPERALMLAWLEAARVDPFAHLVYVGKDVTKADVARWLDLARACDHASHSTFFLAGDGGHIDLCHTCGAYRHGYRRNSTSWQAPTRTR